MSDESGSNNTLKYVGIGCLIAVVLAGCGLGGCLACFGAAGFGGYVALAAPADAAHGFLRECRTGNASAAHGRLSPAYAAAHPAATFAAEVDAVPALRNATDATISNRNVNGTLATMRGTLDGVPCPTGGNTCTAQVTVELSQSGESWLIDLVTIDGVPL